MLWRQVSLRESAVVEHKAQTHFEGFALLSHLLCVGYLAAHMYLERGNVRHIQIAHLRYEIADSALSFALDHQVLPVARSQ